MTAPAALAALPREVRDLALRLGATEDHGPSTVSLEQHGTMRSAPGARPMAFKAHQTIAIETIGFDWRARCGPFGALSVADTLRKDRGGVRVRLMGMIPVATSINNPAVIKGETIRYLAELPLAPDAILRNANLTWIIIDEHSFAVSALGSAGVSKVILRLSPDGLVASIEANDRPRIEGDVTVERPWHGRFSAYRRFGGRMVPTLGEVSWILPSGPFKTWEGEITAWALN